MNKENANVSIEDLDKQLASLDVSVQDSTLVQMMEAALSRSNDPGLRRDLFNLVRDAKHKRAEDVRILRQYHSSVHDGEI